MNETVTRERVWDSRRTAKQRRVAAAAGHADGKLIRPAELRQVLEAVIHPGDTVALEGDNQKQADFLSRTLAGCDPGRLHDLHMLIGSVSRAEHLDLFEQGIASRLDLAYAGPQSVRMAQLAADGTVTVDAIHTYVELYARMLVDLRPDVALLCASAADRHGNLVLCQLAGQYAIDMFIGSTLQMDARANSSTVTKGGCPGSAGPRTPCSGSPSRCPLRRVHCGS
ncbi:malonate decarboxylase subunit alpha [Dactylosporangium sp. NPDC050688]|uniref:malonate decarboxylase subunit alpha n=1 Tax=Dactylosporangium sp. NPDC050688 TaxID=3157217 RepID=UPI0033FAD240